MSRTEKSRHAERLPPEEAFATALAIAALAHEGAIRKGKKVPYIVHPVQVAFTLREHGFSQEVVLAALLHDVLEDMDWDDLELRKRFTATFSAHRRFFANNQSRKDYEKSFRLFLSSLLGPSVLKLVKAVTERKRTAGGKERSWKIRKAEVLSHLRKATSDQAALKAADTLSNIREIVCDLRNEGIRTMDRFKATSSKQARYYHQVADIVQRVGADHALAQELTVAEEEFRHALVEAIEVERHEMDKEAEAIKGLEANLPRK